MRRHSLLAAIVIGVSCACIALPLSPRRARASTFDSATGKLSIAGAAYSQGFEAGLEGIAGAGIDKLPFDLASRHMADGASLEGTKVLLLGGLLHRVEIDLAAVAPKLVGRRVEVRLWEQPRGTAVGCYLTWAAGAALVAAVRLVPTGRGTDDGYRELTSGPIDFALGGKIGPSVLLQDVQLDASLTDEVFGGDGAVRLNEAARVAIDGIEVIDLGAAMTAGVDCDGGNEAGRCGASGVCLFGKCVDSVAASGVVPPGDTIRHGFVDRVRFFYQAFEGSRASRKILPDLDAGLSAVRDSHDPRAFWTAFRRLQVLHDAHAYPMLAGSPARLATGVCLGLGDADLLPGAPREVPMVFGEDPAKPGGGLVQAGDVLVSIDSVPPATWIENHAAAFYVPGDPETAPLVHVQSIMNAAAQSGSKLRFSRCDRNSHSSIPCSASEVVDIEVDLGALLAGKVWSSGLTAASVTEMDCDGRFGRAFSGHESYGYTFADSKDVDPSTRLVFINGVPGEGYVGGAKFKTKLTEAMSVIRPRFILDERVGGGGWPDPAFGILFGSLFAKTDRARSEMIPGLEGAAIDPTLSDMRACMATTGSGYECGYYESWEFDPKSATASNSTAKLAVMMGIDVSGNDFLTRLVKLRSGRTRIFGVVPGYGGYGRVQFLPTLGIALGGGSVQVQDAIFVVDDSDPTRVFETGTGVKPDVVVRERQSDAIVSRDTLYETALAWTVLP